MKERKIATKRAKRLVKDAKVKATADDAGINVDSSQLTVLKNVHKEQSRRRRITKRAEKAGRAAKDATLKATADDDNRDIVDSFHSAGFNKARNEMMETEGAPKESQWAANNVKTDPPPGVDPSDMCSTCLPPTQPVAYTPQPGVTFVRWD